MRPALTTALYRALFAEWAQTGYTGMSLMLHGIAAARRQFGNQLLDRAIARNELHEDLDRELALDLLFSALHRRMIIRRKSFTNSDLDRLVIAMDAAIEAC